MKARGLAGGNRSGGCRLLVSLAPFPSVLLGRRRRRHRTLPRHVRGRGIREWMRSRDGCGRRRRRRSWANRGRGCRGGGCNGRGRGSAFCGLGPRLCRRPREEYRQNEQADGDRSAREAGALPAGTCKQPTHQTAGPPMGEGEETSQARTGCGAPKARMRASASSITQSGVEAPAVMPTRWAVENQSGISSSGRST